MGQRKNESRKFQIKLGMGPAFKAQLAKPTHMLDEIRGFPSSPAVSGKRSTYGWQKYASPLVKAATICFCK